MQHERFSLLEVAPARVSDAQIGALLQEHFGLSGRLERLGGERDLNCRVVLADGSSRLLKLSHPLEDPQVVDFHNQAMLRIKQHDPDLPVQRVHRSLAGDYATWVELDEQRMLVRLLSFVDGVPLYQVDRPSEAFRHTLGQSLARFDRALQGFEHPAAGHTLLWDMQHAEHLRPMLEYVEAGEGRRLVERGLDQFAARVLPCMPQLRRQVIHNDMNPHNIIVDAENPDVLRNILDFGDMVLAPLVNDVAVAASYYLDRSGDVLQPALDIIAAYHHVHPLTDQELALLPELLSTRLALSLCINSWRAELHPENRPYIHRNSERAWANLRALAARSRAEIEDRIFSACRQEVKA
jgi:hydroxylysine kinase